MAIINAYALYNLKYPNKFKKQREFREALMFELVGEEPSRRNWHESKKRKHEPDNDASPHYPAHMSSKRDCVYCSSQSRHNPHRKETVYGCSACDVYLCVDPCFRLFHESDH
jgi:hypothetical protein